MQINGQFVFAVVAGLLATAGSAGAAEPITVGKARFSFMTDRMVRMEYAPDGKFEDSASLVFVDRASTAGKLNVRRDGKGAVIESAALKLVYRGGDFSADTLSIEMKDFRPFGDCTVWRFGDRDDGNLLGTTRTLDAAGGFRDLSMRMENGILSRGGWSVIDDSKGHLLKPTASHWERWVAPRAAADGYRDLVFFGYGHDYRGALKDYVRVAGRIPLPPRWAFGFWSSRYWPYSDDEIDDMVDTFQSYGVPMDVMIIDMDWHETWNLGFGGGQDEFGQNNGWTGYTWKKNLFVNPEASLRRLHDRGLKVALNIHPASGVQPMEDCYDRFTKAYGWEGAAKRQAVPYRLSEEKWADCWYDEVLKPLEAQGVDFWWIDWQQWLISKYVPGLSNTFWLNRTMNRHESEKTDAAGRQLRPLIYHRWGGLGSHRYQMGFSGDTFIQWPTLRMIPYFTTTSGNVGYGYWGHDIGGHMGTMGAEGAGREPELFLRWLQSGVFTPLFKIHSTRDPSIERVIWNYPAHFNAMRETIRLRYRLAPYVYTAARTAYDTGVSICRPLYWDDGESDDAYTLLPQVSFGDDIVAATVCEHTDSVTGLAKAKFRLPGGSWYDAARGDVLAGEKTYLREYTIDENPYFVRAGAVIPQYPASVNNLAAAKNDAIDLLVAPGAPMGDGELYEDDGIHADYAEKFARTRFEMRTDGRKLSVKIAKRQGSYEGMPDSRVWRVILPNRLAPRSVTFNGLGIPWKYDGRLPGVIAAAPAAPAGAAAEFVFEFNEPAAEGEQMLAGVRAVANRARILSAEVKKVVAGVFPQAMAPDAFLDLACVSSRLAEFPSESRKTVEKLRADLAAFDDRFAPMGKGLPENLKKKIAAWIRPESELPLPPPSLKVTALKVSCFDCGKGADNAIILWKNEVTGKASQCGYAIRIAEEGGRTVWSSDWNFAPGEFALVSRPLDSAKRYRCEVRTFADDGTVSESASVAFRPSDCRVAREAAATGNRGYDFIKDVWRRWRRTGDQTVIIENWMALEASEVFTGRLANPTFGDDVRAIRAGWLMKEMQEATPGIAPVNRYYGFEMEARRQFAERHQNADGSLKPGHDGAAEILQALKARCFDSPAVKEAMIGKLKAALEKNGLPAVKDRFEADETFTTLTDDAGLGELAWMFVYDGKFESALAAAAETWKLEYGAGIREWWCATGYTLFTLGPVFDEQAGAIERVYKAPMGEIRSSWISLGGGKFRWSYAIPAGSAAMVRLPDGSCSYVDPGEYTVEVDCK